jgi:hypothetical protein
MVPSLVMGGEAVKSERRTFRKAAEVHAEGPGKYGFTKTRR